MSSEWHVGRCGTGIGNGAGNGEARVIAHIPKHAAQRTVSVAYPGKRKVEIVEAEHGIRFIHGSTAARLRKDAVEPAFALDGLPLAPRQQCRRYQTGHKGGCYDEYIGKRGTDEDRLRQHHDDSACCTSRGTGPEIDP
jgi:hypothetical protein